MIVGWDLGGAHVKRVILGDAGEVVTAQQMPCALWRGLDEMASAMRALQTGIDASAVHAVTMTGELVDHFADRRSGVERILEAFVERAGRTEVRVYADGGFASPREAKQRWQAVASANWHASATLASLLVPDALLLDVGSTTTDVVPIAGGRVAALGRSDHERLVHEELVYTGVVRTPLMAIAGRVPFAGHWVPMMAEFFATSGDLYRILGGLDPAFDQAETADGADKSETASLRRVARMVGCDLDDAAPEVWRRLARWLAGEQRALIRRACERVLSRGLIGDAAPVIGLGAGAFLAERVAASLERPYRAFASLFPSGEHLSSAIDVCGPAFAVAELARRALR